jgi:hypothetical protein
MANSWGESGTTWSQGDWGNQNNWTQAISGITLSANIGTVVASSEQGWGRDNWGQEPWGESYSPTIAITGFSITSELGELPYAQSEEGWGRDEWGTGNWGQNTTTVLIDGFSMSTSLGPDGWGVNSFGNGQWGGEFTFDIESIIVPTGVTLAADIGDITISRLDMIFSISSPGTIGTGLGTLNINNGSDHTQGLASFAVPNAVGSLVVTPTELIDLTGLQITAPTPADLEPTSVELINLTGVTFSADIGSTTVDSMAVGLTGVTFAADVGAISPTNMTVGLTGQSITVSLNTVGFGTIGYEDVDITGNTSYTDVNHAA